jgi:hypothetical protein
MLHPSAPQLLTTPHPHTHTPPTHQVLKFLRELLGPSMSLYLNPFRELGEVPLKSYYRWGWSWRAGGLGWLAGAAGWGWLAG